MVYLEITVISLWQPTGLWLVYDLLFLSLHIKYILETCFSMDVQILSGIHIENGFFIYYRKTSLTRIWSLNLPSTGYLLYHLSYLLHVRHTLLLLLFNDGYTIGDQILWWEQQSSLKMEGRGREAVNKG